MKENRVELDVKLQLDDVTKYYYSITFDKLKNSLKKPKNLGIILGLLLILSTAALFIFRNAGNRYDETVKPSSFPIGVVVVLIIIIALTISFISTLNKNIKNISKKNFESNKLLQTGQRYVFSNDGVEVNSENGYNRYVWDNVNRIEEYAQLYALFISDSLAYLIPKRYFRDKGEIDMFRNIIKTNLSVDKLKNWKNRN